MRESTVERTRQLKQVKESQSMKVDLVKLANEFREMHSIGVQQAMVIEQVKKDVESLNMERAQLAEQVNKMKAMMEGYDDMKEQMKWAEENIEALHELVDVLEGEFVTEAQVIEALMRDLAEVAMEKAADGKERFKKIADGVCSITCTDIRHLSFPLTVVLLMQVAFWIGYLVWFSLRGFSG